MVRVPGRRRGSWARGAAYPLVALGVHTLAAALLLRVPARAPAAPPPAARAEERRVDVELVTTPEDDRSERVAAVTPQAVEERAVARAPRGGGRADAPAAHPRTAEGPSGAEPEGPPSAGPTIAAPAPIDLGLSGPNRFVPKSAEAVERAESARALKQALRNAAQEHDRVLGLGPEGPVLAALASGTSRSLAPVRGRAVFVATANGAGEVIAIELEDAEGGRPGWADAARVAMQELAGKKLRLAPGATRAVMKIEVVSAWKLPSGQDPGTNVSIMHVPVSKGEGPDSAKVSILEPKIQVDYLELAPGAKIPVPSVSLSIFGSNWDPSNAGAQPRRVIHTRALETQVM